MRRANSCQAELLELELPPQPVIPSALRLSPAPAASRADLARNWRRVRETSLIDNSPHPFDPQHHPSRPTEFLSVADAYHFQLDCSEIQLDCSESSAQFQQAPDGNYVAGSRL